MNSFNSHVVLILHHVAMNVNKKKSDNAHFFQVYQMIMGIDVALMRAPCHALHEVALLPTTNDLGI